MPAYTPINPPQTLGDAIRPIAEIPDEGVNALASALSTPQSFSLTEDQLNVLSEKIPGVNLTFLVGALSYLYSHVERMTKKGASFQDTIKALVDELSEDAKWSDKNEVIARLSSLLKPNPIHASHRKLQRLRSGFIPNATDFASFVDVRPDFEGAETLSINHYLLMIQFRVATDAPSGENRRLVFQMTESKLADLKKAVERAEAKIRAIRNEPQLLLKMADEQ
jgi:hypothetical protein